MINEIKLSKDFRWKLKNLQGKIDINITIEQTQYTSINSNLGASLPGCRYVNIKVDLSDHSNPNYDLEECKKWVNLTCSSLFKKQYSIDIGPFEGLFPIKIDGFIIELSADIFNFKPSWKDWFIMEGDEYFK